MLAKINRKIDELIRLKNNIDDVYKFSIDVYNVNEELQNTTEMTFLEKMAFVNRFNEYYKDTTLKKMNIHCKISDWQRFFGNNDVLNLENIKVSIQVPVYNKAQFGLSRALDSLINQTHKNLEIICVNDASTDNSLEIIQEYAKKDSRIKVINFETNRKVLSGRVASFEVATGDYITAVDPDDWVDNDYIEQMLTNILKLNVDVLKVYAPVPIKKECVIYGAIGEIPFLSEEWNDSCISVNVCGKIYKSTLIKQSLDTLKELRGINNADDALINSIVLRHAQTAGVMNIKAKYHYEPNENSITAVQDFYKSIDDILYVTTIIRSLYNNFYVDRNSYAHLNSFFSVKFGLSDTALYNERYFFSKLDNDLSTLMLTFSYTNIDKIKNQHKKQLDLIKQYKLDKVARLIELLFPCNSIQEKLVSLLYRSLRVFFPFMKKLYRGLREKLVK